MTTLEARNARQADPWRSQSGASMVPVLVALVVIAALGAVLFGRSKDQELLAIPPELVGVWSPDAPGARAARLELADSAVTFRHGSSEAPSQRVLSVKLLEDGARRVYELLYEPLPEIPDGLDEPDELPTEGPDRMTLTFEVATATLRLGQRPGVWERRNDV